MKKIFAAIMMLALNVASPAFAQESPQPRPDCAATGTALPHDLQAWSEVATKAAGVLAVGQTVSVPLVPLKEVRFIIPPERPKAPETFGGTITVDIARAGTYRVSLSEGAWIDVIRDGEAVASTAHGHGPECTSIRKIVAFPLMPGKYTLQFSVSPEPIITALVTPAM